MESDLTRAKQAVRRELRRRLKGIPAEGREKSSRRIRSRLASLPEWRSARVVFLFYSQPPEPDVCPLIQEALAEGRRVALPAFDAKSGRYLARLVCLGKGGSALVPGAFGITEPPPENPVLSWNEVEFVAVPGLGFTPDGRRIGKGRGYYDRLLAEMGAFRCGIAWDEQILEEIPTGPGDEMVDCVLTPSREWRSSRSETSLGDS